MATGTRGGATYAPPTPVAPKDQPGQAPTEPAPLKPALTHLEQPHPVLQAAGFTGGIQAFNDRVQKVVDAHRHAYGTDPTPGLTLDVARSDADPTHLFSVPLSPLVARAQATLQKHKQANPDDYFQTNAHGMLEVQTPLTRMINQVVAHPAVFTAGDNVAGLVALGNIDISHRPVAHNADGTISTVRSISIGINGKEVLIPTVVGGKVVSNDEAIAHYKQTGENLGTFDSVPAANRYAQQLHRQQASEYKGAQTSADLQKSHPWVPAQAGFLPIDAFGGLVSALATLDKHGVTTENGQVIVGGQTLNQYQQQTNLVSGLGTLGKPAAPPDSTIAKLQHETGQQQASAINANVITHAVSTVKQAQDELRKNFPAYFSQLTSDGNFSQDWVKATVRFQSSATYYQAATKRLAADNHFDSTGSFIKAWKLKQDLIRKNAGASSFLQHQPLAFFGNGRSVINFLDGDTHGWGFANLPTVGLHTLVGLGHTVFDESAASAAVTKATLAQMTDYWHSVLPTYLGGKGEGDKEAWAQSQHVLRENPTYLRILYPDLPAHPTGLLAAADGFSNLALDIFLGNRLVVGGAAVGAGDTAALASHRYFKGATQLAFNSMKKRGIDGVGEASKLLQGGEGLNVAAAGAIKSGEMTLGQYRAHVADLYHHGRTEIAEPAASVKPPNAPGLITLHASETPNGTVLRSLRTKELPNKTLAREKIKTALDQYDKGLRNSGLKGTTSAANMWSTARQLIGRAAPGNEARRIYDAKTPDDIFNWVVRNIGDRELAYTARNDFVVSRSKQDIPAIQDLNKSLLERYAAEHPNVKGKPSPLEESSGPGLEAESLSSFKFLGGRQKDPTDVFDRLQQRSQAINSKLLSAARVHRQVIISGFPLPGGESLFWKHTVADTLRRFAGGGGLSFKLDEAQKAARTDVSAFFKDNPSALREHSAQRASAEMGEVAWLTRNRPEQYLNFNTGDHLADAKKMEGAGAYLRHLVTDDALNAYRASTKADRTPLFRHVWHSSFYQNLIAKSEDFKKDAALIKEQGLAADQQVRLLSDLKKSYAQDWADALWQRYRAVDDAGTTANVQNALELAAQVAREHPGAKLDAALGKFVTDSKLAFDVKDAPVKGTMFDGWMSRWTSRLLTFNKLNRRTFYDHIFYDTYHELATSGWEKADAVAAASDLAKAQTIYHMLDFSNMLQVEQNLRWLSYYATKHRLYWTWIGRQFAKKPFLAAAVSDIANVLDPKGNLNVDVHGHRLSIPAARLVWANSTEYPETSPIVQAGVQLAGNLFKGQSAGNAVANAFAAETATSGNVFTRQDQGIALLAKYVGMLSGATPATFGLAVDGMSPIQRSVFNQEMHGYILSYRVAHDGRYPAEADAVKATLLRTTGNEVWRTNLFLPVLPSGGKPTEIQKLITAFGNLNDPKKRRDFLDKHPEIQDYFGASQDQDVFLHEQPLWDQFNSLSKQRDLELRKVRLETDRHGYSVELANEVKAISTKYSKAIQDIRTQDALHWKGNATYPAGRVADNGEIQTEGPWSRKLDGDPTAAKAFLHEAFPDIAKGQLDAHTIGQTAVDLQNEANRIRQLGWKRLGYPDAQTARDRVAQISQKLDVFRSFPKNATQQMVSDYYSTFIDPYRKERDAWVLRLASTPSSDKNKVFAEFRAWKETHDHTVTVTDPVSGKKTTFPSPASWGFSQLPPDEYKQALALAASSRWQDISGYEKTLLGVKTAPDVAAGWALYEKTLTDWGQDPANAGRSIGRVQKASVARQIDKFHPGFYKDYLFAQQPKIVRYESTTLYQNLPPDAKQKFDSVIGSAAKSFAAAAKQGGRSYYMDHWRDAVKTTILPWLDEPAQAPLKAELQSFGPRWIDFLNTLPTTG